MTEPFPQPREQLVVRSISALQTTSRNFPIIYVCLLTHLYHVWRPGEICPRYGAGAH